MTLDVCVSFSVFEFVPQFEYSCLQGSVLSLLDSFELAF